MIQARIAPFLRSMPAALTIAVACASSSEAPSAWPELQGDVGGGGFGGVVVSGGGDPTTSSASSSSAGGAPGSGGGGAGPSEGGGAPCGDTGPGEPNENEATATALGSITDCDDTSGNVAGVLTSETDVDWYRYSATDDFGCSVDPSRAFSPPQGARLCKFAQCSGGGAADVSCELGSSPATSPSGRPGCCHTQSFSMDIDCAGADDDASIFLRVDRPAAVCTSYSILFHY
jgi:hypothetical protein